MLDLNTGKSLLTSINKGLGAGTIDGTVEPLIIEPIHTNYNGNPLLILIEPADLSIDDSVSISMGAGKAGYGRMDPIATYSGTSRSIEISFKMIKSEVINGPEAVTNNTVTANLLKQLLYPAYIDTGTQNTSVIKTAPYFKVKYGDLIGNFEGESLAGFFSSVNISNSAGGKVGDNLGFGVGGAIIPIEYSVRITFNVLHDHVVGWYDNKFAGDGRINWPYRTGLDSNITAGGPGGIGGNNVGVGSTPIPGTPGAVSAGAFQGGGDVPDF